MDKELVVNIIEAKKGNNDAIVKVLNVFDNIINKYSRKLNGSDTKQELYVFLMNLIRSIEYNSIIKYEDKQILAYFSKALKNEYIKLSKENDRKNKNEIYNGNEIVCSSYSIDSDIEVLDYIKILNDYERYIINMVVFNGYKISEIANNTGKSRQAINQVKNRALKKLRKLDLT